MQRLDAKLDTLNTLEEASNSMYVIYNGIDEISRSSAGIERMEVPLRRAAVGHPLAGLQHSFLPAQRKQY